MKILFFFILLLSTVIIASAQPKLQEINAVLHDESYLAATGHLPTPTTNETERIQVHLSYVEELLSSANHHQYCHQSCQSLQSLETK